MKAIVVNRHGGAEELTLTEVDTPVPGIAEIAIDVKVAGVNYLDIYQREGAVRAPFIAGVEGVGVVTAAGDALDRSWVGQRVGWLNVQGSLARSVVTDPAKVIPVPDDFPDDAAAALLMQGVTAHYLARSITPIEHGTIAVVHAAAGGVGRLLVQVLTHLGATVIGIASTPEKRKIAEEAGAQHSFGYDDFDLSVLDVTDGRGADVIYDGVGESTFEASLRCLAVRGLLVSFGAASGQPPALEVKQLAGKSLSVIRPSVAHYTSNADEFRARAEQVFEWARDGVITVAISAHFPLEESVQAQRSLESRSGSGKILVEVAG